jgi:4-amino-4-deoxy-L-arabinose transferase-like glycosyltransferase
LLNSLAINPKQVATRSFLERQVSALLGPACWTFGILFCLVWLASLILFPVYKGLPLGFVPIVIGVAAGLFLCAPAVRWALGSAVSKGSTAQFLLVILAAAAALRAVAILVFPHEPMNDPSFFHRYALQMYRGEGYGQAHGFGWRAFYPPGMSLLLTAWYKLTSPTVIAGQILNLLFGLGTVLLVYDIGKRAFTPLVARWAALLAAVLPTLVIYTSTLGYEIVLGTILLAVCDLLVAAPEKGKGAVGTAVLVGMLLGFGALVKPICLLMPLVFVPFWLVKAGVRRTVVNVSVVGAAMACVVAPWTLRNYRVLGAFVPVSTNGGVVFYSANSPFTNGPANTFAVLPMSEEMDEVERERYCSRCAVNWIKGHPWAFAKLAVNKAVFTWGTSSSIMSVVSYDRMPKWQEDACKALINVFWSALSVVCVFATFKTAAWRSPQCLPSFLLLAYVFSIHLVAEAMSRHHVPVLGVLILVAAAGLGTGRRLRPEGPSEDAVAVEERLSSVGQVP